MLPDYTTAAPVFAEELSAAEKNFPKTEHTVPVNLTKAELQLIGATLYFFSDERFGHSPHAEAALSLYMRVRIFTQETFGS